MTVSSKLNIIQLQEAQANKAAVHNTAIDQLEDVLSAKYSLDTSAATTAGDEVTIPYDTSNDLSDRTALRFIYLVLDAGATADFDVVHPENPHLFYCTNNTTQVATITTTVGSTVDIAAGETGLLLCTGMDIEFLAANAGGGGTVDLTGVNITLPADHTTKFYGTPTDNLVTGHFLIARDTAFPADFAGSVGAVTTNPSAATSFAVKDDGTDIGTIDISTGGVVTFTTTGNTAKAVTEGSILTIVAPATADTSLVDVFVNLEGTFTQTQ